MESRNKFKAWPLNQIEPKVWGLDSNSLGLWLNEETEQASFEASRIVPGKPDTFVAFPSLNASEELHWLKNLSCHRVPKSYAISNMDMRSSSAMWDAIRLESDAGNKEGRIRSDRTMKCWWE